MPSNLGGREIQPHAVQWHLNTTNEIAQNNYRFEMRTLGHNGFILVKVYDNWQSLP